MSDIPYFGEHGYVAPASPSTPLIEANIPTTDSSGRFWRWLLLVLLIIFIILCLIKALSIINQKRKRRNKEQP